MFLHNMNAFDLDDSLQQNGEQEEYDDGLDVSEEEEEDSPG